MSNPNTQIYIGGLKGEVLRDDLKYEFKRFGTIVEFSYKGRYAFIEYEDGADASRAIKEMDDTRVNRVRITVEAARKFIFVIPAYLKQASNVLIFLMIYRNCS